MDIQMHCDPYSIHFDYFLSDKLIDGGKSIIYSILYFQATVITNPMSPQIQILLQWR